MISDIILILPNAHIRFCSFVSDGWFSTDRTEAIAHSDPSATHLHIPNPNIMYRIRLYLVAAAFLVTAVSGNLTSASFGRRRGILPSCIVGSSRVSHRRHRQMRSGTPIALGGSSLSIRYPPSSVGLSSLATAVYLRVGSIDADSSSFELGRSQNYVSNSAAREALGMRGGATVAEGINNTHVEKDQGWRWWYVFFRCAVPIRNLTLLDLVFLCWAASRFNGPAVPRSTENNVSNSATSADLAMRGGATMTGKACVEDDMWWVWWYLALRLHYETWKITLLDLLFLYRTYLTISGMRKGACCHCPRRETPTNANSRR